MNMGFVMLNRGGVFNFQNLIVRNLEDLGHEDLPAIKSRCVGSLIGL